MKPSVKPKIYITILTLLLFLLFIPISEAGLRECAFEMTVTNGLKVILLEDHKAPSITFHVWYRVGSRNETWGRMAFPTHLSI